MPTLLKIITTLGESFAVQHSFKPALLSSFSSSVNISNASSDLLGLSTPPATQSQTGTLIDVLGDIYSATNGNSNVINNAKKYENPPPFCIFKNHPNQ